MLLLKKEGLLGLISLGNSCAICEGIMKNKELLDILEKKARGFFYTETVEEFSRLHDVGINDNKPDSDKECRVFDNNFCDNIEKSIKSKHKNGKVKNVDADLLPKNIGVLECAKTDDLVLVKKKSSTFYVPPDISALKMLFEMSSKSDKDFSIEKLVEKRKKLLDEILSNACKSGLVVKKINKELISDE